MMLSPIPVISDFGVVSSIAVAFSLILSLIVYLSFLLQRSEHPIDLIRFSDQFHYCAHFQSLFSSYKGQENQE